MGTITGISDLDPVRWKNSQWRNLQVGWDESAAGERRNRVSLWEIEPVAAPFFICPPPFFRSKRPRQPGMPDDESSEMENLFKRAMPWLGEEICIKDAQSQNTIMPGLSLVQWMNMQQNPTLTNPTMQPDYMRSLTGPMIQNLGTTDISRQLGLQAQMLQAQSQSQAQNIQFNNTPRLPQNQPQQVDQLSKMSTSQMNQLGNMTHRPQQQMQDMGLQQRQQLVNQATAMNLPQSQNNIIQSQMLAQNQHTLMQNNQQQQLLQQMHQQNQQQQPQILQQQQLQSTFQTTNQANQQLQLSDQQLQLLQKLQQHQQSYLQQQSRMPQIQGQTPQSLYNSNSMPQQQCVSKPASVTLPQSSTYQPQQKQILLPELPATVIPNTVSTPNMFSSNGNSLLTPNGLHSGLIADDIPSFSTSNTTNNCTILPQQILNKSQHKANPQSAATMLEAITSATPNVIKEAPKSEPCVKPSAPISAKMGQQAYLNTNTAQMDYLDTSSSATSVCLSQTDGPLHQGYLPNSFNQPSMFRDPPQDCDVTGDARNSVLFGADIDSGPLGMPDSLLANSIDSGKYNNTLSGNVITNYSNSKDAQQEISSSMVSQSFGVPDMAFNSIDPTINDSSFLNKSPWPPAPQYQRMRTYTKVHKRGAVGRSIDISSYSGYDELRRDLARMFSIEGQLEDKQRIGWKLVYVDHENDVLLVGDDPWEEFVNCVRFIKILSPQEVQQMRLDGDLNASMLPNQACSSSDGGNAWKGHCDQNSGNPSTGSYDQFE